MLKIQQLRVSYGGIQALRGIDLEVPDGKIVTLIGANGAGKSTTLRTISGLVKAESGSIQWNGEELLGKPIDKIISAGIAMSPEGRRVFADLTVLENLKLGAYLRKDKAEIEKDLKWVYELFPRLEERNWQSAGTLSGGEQQMLAVGRALMSRPKLMMLDEPSLGLAPLVVQDIFSIIREINRQGVTVLLIEQNANMALKIADLAYVLETGNITMSGTGAELLAQLLFQNGDAFLRRDGVRGGEPFRCGSAGLWCRMTAGGEQEQQHGQCRTEQRAGFHGILPFRSAQHGRKIFPLFRRD